MAIREFGFSAPTVRLNIYPNTPDLAQLSQNPQSKIPHSAMDYYTRIPHAMQFDIPRDYIDATHQTLLDVIEQMIHVSVLLTASGPIERSKQAGARCRQTAG